MRRFIARMRLRHKFALIAAIMAVMIGMPTWSVVQSSSHDVRTARRQVDGLAACREGLHLVQLTQQHRGLSSAFLGGDAGAQAGREAKAREVESGARRLAEAARALGSQKADERIASMHSALGSLEQAVGEKALSARDSAARHQELIAVEQSIVADLVDVS